MLPSASGVGPVAATVAGAHGVLGHTVMALGLAQVRDCLALQTALRLDCTETALRAEASAPLNLRPTRHCRMCL